MVLGRLGVTKAPIVSAAKAVPIAIWWLTALHAVLLVGHALVVAPLRGPDEVGHVSLILDIRDDHSFPNWNTAQLSGSVCAARAIANPPSAFPFHEAEAAPAHSSRRGLDELEPTLCDRENANHIAQHPPLYYASMAAGSRALDLLLPGDGLGSFSDELLALRLLSALFVLPLPLLAWTTARAVRAPPGVALAAPLLLVGLAQLTSIGAGVNNDALVWLLGSLLIIVCLRIGVEGLHRRRTVAAGVLAGLALLTKAVAFPFPVFVVAALTVAPDASRTRRLQAGALAIGLAFLTGGWWWASNLVRFGELVPSVDYGRFAEAPPGFTPSFGAFLSSFLWALRVSTWGAFGSFDKLLGDPFASRASVVLALVLLAAFTSGRHHLGVHRRGWVVGAMLLPAMLLAVSVGVTSWRRYLSSGATPMQGRYLFSGACAVAVVAALGLWCICGRRTYITLLVAGLAGGYLQTRAFTTVLSAYWGSPPDDVNGQVDAWMSWVGFGRWIVPVWLVSLTIAVTLVVWSIVRAVRAGTPQSVREELVGPPPAPAVV